ncbi:unnamed protein product [Dovyalis caffra]|uniref:Uncharacterized protein n=1 Tax=Dovyalis caffra TaxID=77055 RepID=A0AAV1R3X4_9ROSI|nr:unnamed protein product [Dovyalis caffra]
MRQLSLMDMKVESERGDSPQDENRSRELRDSLMLLFTNPFLVDLARLIAEDKSAEIATWNPE